MQGERERWKRLEYLFWEPLRGTAVFAGGLNAFLSASCKSTALLQQGCDDSLAITGKVCDKAVVDGNWRNEGGIVCCWWWLLAHGLDKTDPTGWSSGQGNLCVCFPLLFMEEKYPSESKDSSLSVLFLLDQLSSPGGPSLNSSFFSSEDPSLLSSSLFKCHSLSWGIKSRSLGHDSTFFEQPLSISFTHQIWSRTTPIGSPFFDYSENQQLAINWKYMFMKCCRFRSQVP